MIPGRVLDQRVRKVLERACHPGDVVGLEKRHIDDGVDLVEDQRELIRSTGGEPELIDICQDVNRMDPEEVLDKTRRRIHSWSWSIADDVFEDCLVEYEPWFHAHYPDEIVEELTHELEIWRWPA